MPDERPFSCSPTKWYDYLTYGVICSSEVIGMKVLQYRIINLLICSTPVLLWKISEISDLDFHIIFFIVVSCGMSVFFRGRISGLSLKYILPVIWISYFSAFEQETISELKTVIFGKDLNFSTDVMLCVAPIYYTLCVCNLKCILPIILSKLQRVTWLYGEKRIIIYIIFCSVHALVFVFLLYYAVVNITSTFGYYITSWDKDNSTIFSVEVNATSRQDYVDLNPLRSFEKMLLHERYITHKNKTKRQAGFSAFATNFIDRDHLPLCRRIYYRVEGEDVSISCRLYNLYHSIIVYDHYDSVLIRNLTWEWELDKNLQNDTHHSIVKTENTPILNITSLLPVHFQYEIILWGVYIRYCQNVQTIIKVKYGSFFVHRDNKILAYVHVPRGHIIFIKGIEIFMRHTHEVSIGHMIRSILDEHISGGTDQLCTSTFQGCGPMISLLFNMSVLHGMSLNSIMVTDSINSEMKLIHSFSCICENAYGQHTFYATRDIFNHSSKSNYISQIVLPYKFIVLPKGVTTFGSKKYTELRKDIQKCLQAERNDWRNYWRYIEDEDSFIYSITYYMEYIISYVVLLDLFVLPCLFVKGYNAVCIRPIARLILIPQVVIPQISEQADDNEIDNEQKVRNIGDFSENDRIIHDVMILNSDDDYEFAANFLVPFFENLGLSVMFPDYDIDGNQLRINAYSEAVMTSRLYVVVGTRNFQSDQWSNIFVLSGMILPRIYELPHLNHHILLIKWNRINIPRPLRWNENVTVFDWLDGRDGRENMVLLERRFRQIHNALTN